MLQSLFRPVLRPIMMGVMAVTGSRRAWTPAALWPTGTEPGMWIDPSNLTSQWQDYAGTTPVATPGTVADSSNPVGLALDIRAGAPGTLGPDLVVNGDFSDGSTGWSWSNIVDGKAVYDGANSDLFQDIGPLKIGAFYQVSWYQSGASIYVRLGGSGNLGSQSGAGQKTMILSSPGTAGLKLAQGGMTPNVDYIDNISVKEVPGNHMLQATSAARPLESARVNLARYTGDLSGWGKDVGVTVTPNYGPAPDFTSTSIRVQFDGANEQVFLTNLNGGGNPGILSLWVKGVSGETLQVAPDFAYSYPVTFTGAWQQVENYSAIADAFSLNTSVSSTARDVEVWHPQLQRGDAVTDYQSVPGDGSTYASGPPIAQLYDGVDDGMATAAFAAGTLIDGMDCMIAVRRDSSAATYLISDTGSRGFFEWGSGDTNRPDVSAGTPTYYVDGVACTATRGALFTALTVGDWHILEARGLDLSTWTALGVSSLASYRLNGPRGDILLYPSTASTEDKDAARQWLADYYGVTLP